MAPPVLVSPRAIRRQAIGGERATPSTRLAKDVSVNRTSGTLVVPPTRPWWDSRSSQSPARVVSPGSGNRCVRVHLSTLEYDEPDRTWVVTVDSRRVIQNVGE